MESAFSVRHHEFLQFLLCFMLVFSISGVLSNAQGLVYDPSAYTLCKLLPEEPLYNGGILKYKVPEIQKSKLDNGTQVSYSLRNLTQQTKYCFSVWIKINDTHPALIRASLTTENATLMSCIGTVIAKQGCWSFLKGGFVLPSSSESSKLNIKAAASGRAINIEISSASLQPFTEEQWRFTQQTVINKERKRAVIIHVSDKKGARLHRAEIAIKQVSRDFPFGSAIAGTILQNSRYQKWFVERFNAAVFENELKWDATEPKQGQVNYTIADQMLAFVRANQIVTRAHTIFWENPNYQPHWVPNLTSTDLRLAVNSRIQSIMNRYKNEFVNWDVSNEGLHYNFYEQRLGPNATLEFFKKANEIDPLATLFMSEFNVVEQCSDGNSTVDAYVEKMNKLKRGGVTMDGIGLQGHFEVPNPPLMRAIMDKLATLGRPIWFTELDIHDKFGNLTQAIYLEEVLREIFSHPAVKGIILWSARHQHSCYRMCLTDNDFNNLPAGDTVDKLLKEWQTGILKGETDELGSYSFYGYLGEYKVTVTHNGNIVTKPFSVSQGEEATLINIQL